MAIEIERKFLIDSKIWSNIDKPIGTNYRQGYLIANNNVTVRTRLAGDKAYLTIKGESKGYTRAEYEYQIPSSDALEMLSQFAGNIVEKIRYNIFHDTHLWEVDVFMGNNEGLIIAEIELTSEDEYFEKPNWLADEVTGDERYYNSSLASKPYKEWPIENSKN